jgi:hypothetical protein
MCESVNQSSLQNLGVTSVDSDPMTVGSTGTNIPLRLPLARPALLGGLCCQSLGREAIPAIRDENDLADC